MSYVSDAKASIFSKMNHHLEFKNNKILLVLRRLVSQLVKPNEKFVYGTLKRVRAAEYEGAIEWFAPQAL